MIAREEAIKQLGDGPERLDAALDGMTEAALDHRYEGVGWTVREIVHHLAEADTRHTFFTRIALVKSGHAFEFSWHPGNRVLADTLGYNRLPIAPSVALFRANRLHLCALLGNSPTGLWWDNYLVVRASPDEAGKEVTVHEWVTGMENHLQEHLAEIHRIRSRLRK